MRTVPDHEIKVYLPLVENLARRFVGVGGAEYDDLVQEGLISVWRALAKDVGPSGDVITGRMIDWTRYIRRYAPVPYEELLPLEIE